MSAFVFDLDGVVCRNGYFTEPLERVHGIARSRWGEFFSSTMLSCIVGKADLKEELVRLLPQLGWRGSVEALLSFWFETEAAVCVEVLGIVADLRSRGFSCSLGTNQERYRTAYLSQVMGLQHSFDQIFSSSELGVAKPSVEFFAKIQKRIGTTNICLVDDSAANVLAAEKFGWRTVHYRGPQDLGMILKVAEQFL
ncbi:MAG TPA: HAD-IA family hydrolase [Opitutaceae bacterium]